jgi:ribosome-binding protein aMBF1 (putative translation factor)
MITPVQCKMARSALGWGVRRLAAEAKVSVSAVNRFEVGHTEPIPITLEALQRAMERAGVEFRPDGSVRLREAADAEL